MTWEPRPVPEVTPETAPFWEGAANNQLLLRYCPDCALHIHFPRSCCPFCFSKDLAWTEAEGIGSVYTYTVLDSAPGWPDEHLPLVLAYIELIEGPRILSNCVDVRPEAVAIGDSVQVTFIPTAESNVAIPVFVLASDASQS